LLVGLAAALAAGLAEVSHMSLWPGAAAIGAALLGGQAVLEAGLWVALSGALAVVTLAVLAGALLLVLPAAVLRVGSLLRGALRP